MVYIIKVSTIKIKMKPKIYTKKMIISLSEEQKEKIARVAEIEIVSMGELVRMAVMDKVENSLNKNRRINNGRKA